MSSTGRGTIRHPDDYYATPGWAVRAILPHLLPSVPRDGSILEPAAGEGAIVAELLAAGVHRRAITAVEIDEGRAFSLRHATEVEVKRWDFRTWARETDERFDLVIGNPPFSLALEFVQDSLSITKPGGRVAMLLRLPWLASQKRAAWLREHTPSVYVLPKRPSFYEGAPPTAQPTLFGGAVAEDAKGSGTDSTDYAWLVWNAERAPTVTILEVA